ncbi:MAG: DAK2 domain-containing protein [Oscillospiraceae bacterium]|nr:DAK2 domain-containing protein [Oscillospiraceae bacterium]
MTHQITGELYKKMVSNGAAAIENNKQEVNDLNVFPVPDGDTGTNMSLTIGAAEKALSSMTPGTLGNVTEATASALLRGARGNSGVILSLLFRGFSRSLKDKDTADAKAFANALTAGVESAYKAVMKPAEGTILTVSRVSAGVAVSVAESESDIEIVLEKTLEAGYEALAETINQNPVLQKAGVIDAGGKGYLYILDGMLQAMRGVVIEKETPAVQESGKADFSQYTAEDITFTYCTEFIVERSKTIKEVNRLRDFLDNRGDSIVVVDDDAIIKVHVHTNDPGAVLTEALTYGSLLSVKIENMREQHSEAAGAAEAASHGTDSVMDKPEETEEMKEFAFVAVCAGKGLEELFHNLGVDRIITGGQTMNPSTEDILEKVVSAPSNTVFVLPNNKNIIMAAEQCIPLTDKRVIVIPTKSIPQGVTAMLTVDMAEAVDEIEAVMCESIKAVHTALITKAARNSVYDDTKIKKNSHLALIDDALTASGNDFNSVISAVSLALSELSPEFITIFTGEDADEKETEVVSGFISSDSPNAELSVISGGQPVYRYIISAE